eukprot:CAMPEP_0197442302 /NCGR_PEP_ID=MMETSP1175-20131217/8350_1 /TAXON_ID=1003142 /ORGANISM="Triceratium dubium, Strain CCMP147" /LENGTH=67 /DNA_ID=CAMNT_0042972747 /DNA_START=16 /DNA_END=215 /DNA_ORIENTATION=-
MISAGLLRTYVGQLLRAKNRKIPTIERRGRADLLRSSRLRGGGGSYVSKVKWEARRAYMSERERSPG